MCEKRDWCLELGGAKGRVRRFGSCRQAADDCVEGGAAAWQHGACLPGVHHRACTHSTMLLPIKPLLSVGGNKRAGGCPCGLKNSTSNPGPALALATPPSWQGKGKKGGRCPYLACGSQSASTMHDLILAQPLDIEELAALGGCIRAFKCRVFQQYEGVLGVDLMWGGVPLMDKEELALGECSQHCLFEQCAGCNGVGMASSRPSP